MLFWKIFLVSHKVTNQLEFGKFLPFWTLFLSDSRREGILEGLKSAFFRLNSVLDGKIGNLANSSNQHRIFGFFVFLLLSMTTICCSSEQSNDNYYEGVYLRTYGRSASAYEQVKLLGNNRYTQDFYRDNELIFTNSGNWTFVNKNQGQSEKWPLGRRLVIFDNWFSADELLRRQSLGYSANPSDIKKETIAAIVRSKQRFAFDEDGGSDYVKQ
jgi:hypothetical protein